MARGRVAGIVLCAGSSSRMGRDKLWEDLGGRPVLAWSLSTLAASACVDTLVCVASQQAMDRTGDLLSSVRPTPRLVVGGVRRRDSVLAGLQAAADAEWCVVHDGARPFVTGEMVRLGLEAAQQTGAAIAAVPVVDTIKVVRDGAVVSTPDRSALWAAQTPQVFRTSLLRDAHERLDGDATDDALMVESLGVTVRTFPGAYGNIKITFPEDLELARALVNAAQPGQGDVDERTMRLLDDEAPRR
jgi:2-C-methyl-D-erythritol 4-phosphate cytidylyltransferase